MVRGDVGVVKVVIDVGVVVVERVGELILVYVILRLYFEVDVILLKVLVE